MAMILIGDSRTISKAKHVLRHPLEVFLTNPVICGRVGPHIKSGQEKGSVDDMGLGD